MRHDDEVELWTRRVEVYRRRNAPVETRAAMRAAVRIQNGADLAKSAAWSIVAVHKEANAAIRTCPDPDVAGAIRDVEATVQMALPVIIARYMLG